MDVFTPGLVPSKEGTVYRVRPRTQAIHYHGDAYHDAPDGIHTALGTATVIWDDIGTGDAATILAFMRAHIAKPFHYQLPHETFGRVWVFKRAMRGFPYTNFDRLEIQLEERPAVS